MFSSPFKLLSVRIMFSSRYMRFWAFVPHCHCYIILFEHICAHFQPSGKGSEYMHLNAQICFTLKKHLCAWGSSPPHILKCVDSLTTCHIMFSYAFLPSADKTLCFRLQSFCLCHDPVSCHNLKKAIYSRTQFARISVLNSQNATSNTQTSLVGPGRPGSLTQTDHWKIGCIQTTVGGEVPQYSKLSISNMYELHCASICFCLVTVDFCDSLLLSIYPNFLARTLQCFLFISRVC